MHREAGEAVGRLWRHRGLRSVCGVAIATNLLGGAMLLPLIVLVGERGGNALDTGTVLAALGVGGLVGALLSRRPGSCSRRGSCSSPSSRSSGLRLRRWPSRSGRGGRSSRWCSSRSRHPRSTW
jgi:hypothetical protein